MELIVKHFDELSVSELYEILKSRSQIFVVEQKCTYQDIDDTDRRSLHIFYKDNESVVAYMRAFYAEDGVVRVGRVLTLEHGKGLGGKLLKNGIEAIKKEMKPDKIYIEAQTHAIGFYERVGFVIVSEEFLDVGIPHVGMELKIL